MTKRPSVGFGVMILKENKVLLGRRHDDPDKASSELHGEGTWTMPGGKLDFGEKLRDAACREVFEETGLRVDCDNLNLISLTNNIVSDAHFVTLGWLCEKFSGSPQVKEPDEITKWRWFELGDLPKEVFPPSRQILENFQTKQIYNE